MGRVTATVLFTDLVGSTELRGRLGEEAADELRRKHDQLLAEAVEKQGGRVVKGLGDGIMATFAGAADGVVAAVAIQQGIDRLNRSGKAPVPLAVRVGLSAGDVTFEDEDVHGTPVIEASRLCGAAGGDEILVSEIVRMLAALPEEDLGDRGRLELKGLQNLVVAWEVRWEPVAVSSIPMPQLLTDVGRIFVGRDAELERLTQLWKEAAAGERRVALLAGEPGVGKTRLTAEVAMRVHEEGGVVLAGRCDEDLGVPYQPFVEALRHFVDHVPPEGLEERLGRYGGELARLLPDLAELAPELPNPVRSDPETERYRLFDAVAGWLTAASMDEPALFVLDDLQWAAKPTLLLLRHVLQSTDIARVFFLGTYRDTELTHDHPLVEFVADLRRQRRVERLPLSGLDDVGVTALIEQAAGRTLDEEGLALAGAIYQETDGNPFFVREVLRHLVESGAVEPREGSWATRLPIEELGIPEGVRDVVGRRLARLAEDTKHVLRVAAVAGAEFEVPVLQAAATVEEERLLAAMEEAAAARLVIEVSATRYRFAHALVRDTLYEGLTAARRVSLHRRVAQAVERCHAEVIGDYLPALAHHWARASAPAADTARAVEYAGRAGDRALAQLAYDEAIHYYRQGLELLAVAEGSVDQSRRLELLIGLGDAERRAGDPGHRVTLFRAARLAQESGDPESMARAGLALNRGVFSVSQRVDLEAVSVLEDALGALSAADSPLRARLMAHQAVELSFSPDDERRHRLANEALAMARRLDDPAAVGHVLNLRGPVFSWTDPTRLQDDAAELLTAATELEDPALEFWANCWAAIGALVAGDTPQHAASVDAMCRCATDLSQPFLQFMAFLWRSTQLRIAGRLDEAEGDARAALEVARRAGIADAFRLYGGGWFRTAYHRGRLDELSDSLTRAAQRAERDPVTLAACALMFRETDRISEARDIFECLAEDDFRSVTSNFMWLYTMTMAAEVCAGVRDPDRAAILYERLGPHRSLVAHIGTAESGCVDHYLGLLALTLDRFDEADIQFSEAQEMHSRMNAPALLARTRLEWARMLLTRRAPGDAQRARELLGKALATAGELGLAKVERDAVALLQECP